MRRLSWGQRRLAILCIVAAAAGIVALPPALSWLAEARDRHASLTALSDAPLRSPRPVVAPDAAFRGSAPAAAAELDAIVRDLALREGALVEQNAPHPSPVPGLIVRHMIVSGSARTMLRFVEAVEARAPAVRLPHYRLSTTASGQSLRLDADLIMAFAP